MYINESAFEQCLEKMNIESQKIEDSINLTNLLISQLIDEKVWQGETRDAVNEKFILLKKLSEAIPDTLNSKNSFLKNTLDKYKQEDKNIDKGSIAIAGWE